MPWARRYIVLSRCLFIRYDTSTACWAGGWTWIGATRDRRRRRQLHSIQKSSPRENGPQEVEVKVKERKKGKKERNACDPGYLSSAKKKQTNTQPPNKLTALGFSSLTSVLLPLLLIFCLVHSRLVVFARPQHIKRQVPSPKSYTPLCFALFHLFHPSCRVLKPFPWRNAHPPHLTNEKFEKTIIRTPY
jgi:hypothetical protein